jgi:hypothetical protein
MRWERHERGEMAGGEPYTQASSPVGIWCIADDICVASDGLTLTWYPLGSMQISEVVVGTYKTEASAKRAAKRYAKRLAAAFQAFAKAGWQ